MGSQESRRLELYNRLQEVLGSGPATTLMTLLPPVETGELLTRTEFKTEIARLDARFDRFEDRFEDRFDSVNKKIDRVLLAVVGGMFVIVAAIITTGLG